MNRVDDKVITQAISMLDALRRGEVFSREEYADVRDDLKRTGAAIEDVASERQRQIKSEGWTAEHDDDHKPGELARAGAAYALHMANFHDAVELGRRYTTSASHPEWPWHRNWWKPKDPRRDLVRAAALIVAEIERIDRMALQTAEGEP